MMGSPAGLGTYSMLSTGMDWMNSSRSRWSSTMTSMSVRSASTGSYR